MMNEEAAVVMAFFTFRVFLVGGIMYAFPRIARKGLLFGAYLGEEQAGSDTRRQLLREWDTGSALIMLGALLVGWSIGLTGRWVTGNLIGSGVLLLPFVPLYFRMHGRARAVAPVHATPRAETSAASLEVDKARGEGFAVLALIVSVVASLALLGYAAVAFLNMPDRIPTLTNFRGQQGELTEKSLASVVLIPSFNLVLAPFFAVMALLIAQSKRSVRGGSGGRSLQAQETFRVAMSHLSAGTGLGLCLFATVVSLDMIRVWQGGADSLGGGIIGGVAVAMMLYMGISLIRIMRLGQGGANLESGSPEAPLTGGLADNARWIFGIWYVDATDPSILVEARWGIGYTMNLGNRVVQVLLAVFLVALLGLTVLTLAAAGIV
ncbi:MAG: DUF5808 domain-containing protein [Longimicrobiales bacterium]